MILSGQTIRGLNIISPFAERTKHNGMSYGLSAAGYDIRIDKGMRLLPGEFGLANSYEHITMPDDVIGLVKDKSTWARRGLVVFNGVLEPGWRGFITLEIKNLSEEGILIRDGDPIAQILFLRLDQPAEQPYRGKYQDQQRAPVKAIHEGVVMV